MTRRLLWASLDDERANREFHWLSLMPDTRVTVAGGPPPSGDVDWIERSYRRPVKRFKEAVALAWMKDMRSVPANFDWIASLELCSMITAQASKWARDNGVRQCVVIWANDPELIFYRLPPYRQALDKARRADLFLNFVRSGYDHCLALGLPEERCAWVLPGVDTALFHPAAAPQVDPVITFASGLWPKKGLSLVLDAFDLVRATVPEARLQIVGSGPDQSVAQAAQERTGGAVRWLGPMRPDQIAAVLRDSAVFTTAPWAQRRWNEQYGLAYLEAMASGLPVVTTISGTNHEAVGPPNIRVPHDAEALAEGLVRFLTNEGLRGDVGRLNRMTVVRDHDMLTQSARMAAVFRTSELQPRR